MLAEQDFEGYHIAWAIAKVDFVTACALEEEDLIHMIEEDIEALEIVMKSFIVCFLLRVLL